MAGNLKAGEGSESIQRACDYAAGSFGQRLTTIENLRNRALIALGIMSASSALLALDGVARRLGPTLWLPGIIFALALIVAIAPLMSVRIVYPVKLEELSSEAAKYSAEEMDQAMLEQIAGADRLAERLSAATALYADWALRLSLLGMVTVAVPVVSPSMVPWVGVSFGFICGLLGVALVELGRLAIRCAGLPDPVHK